MGKPYRHCRELQTVLAPQRLTHHDPDPIAANVRARESHPNPISTELFNILSD